MDAHKRSLVRVAQPTSFIGERLFILIFDGKEVLALKEMAASLTFGGADSTDICIKVRSLAALQGHFVQSTRSVLYRCFQSGESLRLDGSSSQFLSGLSFDLVDEQKLVTHYRWLLLEHFQTLLKNERSVDKAFQKASHLWMGGQVLPAAVQDLLQKSLREVQCESPVEELLKDPEITDILISDHQTIYVERCGRLEQSPLQFVSAQSYHVYLERLISAAGRFVGEDHPYCDFVLSDGSRAHYIFDSVAGGRRYLSIRKIRESPWTLEELKSRQMMSEKTLRLLHQAVDAKRTILIAGATGSGKTSLMRALMHSVCEDERIITIEDTPELSLSRLNRVSLFSRPAQGTSLRAISLRELVRQSLRMRPDRLIIGEVRGEEALDLLHALNTGHSGSFCTVHANSARDALYRIEGLVRMAEASLREELVREWMSRSIHLVLYCRKNESGQRQISEAAWVRGLAGNQIVLESIDL